ncbi:succinoglycan biosynthesis protein ExoM [Ekhidna lutea]|uniref:Succinoglycan biosynthesis protein ExoM n=1 Tax=Ekhidna lutea TaxID=447679 RepID=A0A239FRD1_EKHLU|nr:glycosyltransferase [Ekhidna lutea]SNS59325.1 succinoglycan biosynthesis protein ExoM [Ekhidna lutea]
MNQELIVIGIGTYKRPKMLEKALESLQKLIIPDSTTTQLVIVDNEENSASRDILLKFDFPFKVHYECEPKRGIVHVRNNILTTALELGAQYLAFLDDDEVVKEDWILQLYEAMKTHKADAVEGFVIYSLPEKAPDWLFKKDFYGKRQRKTGTRLFSARTCNVMISMQFVIKHRLFFDERLNETGSSDTYFFRQLVSKGGKLIWCNEAVSYETILQTRANKEWILRRSYKSGFNTVLINSIRFGKPIAIAMWPFYIIQLFFTYLLKTIKNPPINKSNIVFNKRELMELKGAVDALRGKRMDYYKVVHGN